MNYKASVRKHLDPGGFAQPPVLDNGSSAAPSLREPLYLPEGPPEVIKIQRDFAAAVEGELEGGLLRYSKRLELLKLAGKLGIERFQAALIIAQVQHRSRLGPIFSPTGIPGSDVDEQADRQTRRTLVILKIAAMLLAASLVDLILIQVLFG